jgi:hypothetical protein
LLSCFAGYASAWKDEYGSIYFWAPIIGPLIGGVLRGCIYDIMIGEFLPLVEQEVGEQAAEAGGGTACDRAEEGSSTRAIPLALARLRP